MQRLSLCFSAPVPLCPVRAVTFAKQNAPVCVLDERKTVQARPGAASNDGKDAQSPFYKILPAHLHKEQRPKPPAVHWSLPVVGFIVEHWFGQTPAKRARRLGGIYKTSFLLQPMVFVADMPTIAGMQKDPITFRSKGGFDAVEAFFGSNSMTLLDGVEHTAVRNTVAPAFAPNLFPFYFDRIHSRVKKNLGCSRAKREDEWENDVGPSFSKALSVNYR